jgi:hypothetical protein
MERCLSWPKAKTTNTYIRKIQRAEKDTKNLQIKGESYREGERKSQKVTWWTTLRRNQMKRTRHYQEDWLRRSREEIWLSFKIRKRYQVKLREKDHLLQYWGACVDTIFWKKNTGQRRSSRWKTECNRLIEEREGRSTRFADSQRNSTLTVGQQVKAIVRWSTRGSVNWEEEDGNQGDTLEGKHGGGGSIYDWRWVNESVLGSFLTTTRVSFIFSSFYLSLDTSKQCHDRLGVRLSSAHK